MKRGLILTVTHDRYQVVDPEGEFYTVHRAVDPDLPAGEELFWTEEWEIRAEAAIGEDPNVPGHSFQRQARPLYDWSVFSRRWSAVAAGIMFFVFFGLWWFTGSEGNPVPVPLQPIDQVEYTTDAAKPLPEDPRVVAYLTLDINPSVELAVDEKDMVLFVRPVNEDGVQLLDHLNIQGKTVSDAAGELVKRAGEQGFLETNREVVIAVASVNTEGEAKSDVSGNTSSGKRQVEQQSKAVDQRLTQIVSRSVSLAVKEVRQIPQEEIAITAMTVPVALRKEANEHAISMGKLSIYLQANKQGIAVDLNELREKPVTVIAKPFGGVKKLLISPTTDQNTSETKETILRLLEEQKPELEELKLERKSKRQPARQNPAPDQNENLSGSLDRQEAELADEESVSKRQVIDSKDMRMYGRELEEIESEPSENDEGAFEHPENDHIEVIKFPPRKLEDPKPIVQIRQHPVIDVSNMTDDEPNWQESQRDTERENRLNEAERVQQEKRAEAEREQHEKQAASERERQEKARQAAVEAVERERQANEAKAREAEQLREAERARSEKLREAERERQEKAAEALRTQREQQAADERERQEKARQAAVEAVERDRQANEAKAREAEQLREAERARSEQQREAERKRQEQQREAERKRQEQLAEAERERKEKEAEAKRQRDEKAAETERERKEKEAEAGRKRS